MEALGATAQDGGIAGLEAERAGVGGHVRPALVDDADDPERHRDARDLQAVGALPLGQGAADGIGQGGDLLDPRALTSMRSGVSARRSSRASVSPLPLAAPMSLALAPAISPTRARMAAAGAE